MPANEKVGGVEMEASIDLSKVDAGTKKLEQTLQKLDAALKKAERGLTNVEKAGQQAAAGVGKAGLAAQALSAGLGYLGANSVQGVIQKVINLSREAVNLAVSLEGVQARARAIFESGFPRVSAEIERLAQKLRRSQSDLLQFATGFGSLLDSVGVASGKVQELSLSLTEVTANLGKLFPDKSDVEIFNTLQAALIGSGKGLKDLGLTVKDDVLQAWLDLHTATTVQLKDLNDEQMLVLRANVLKEQSAKLTEKAAKLTGTYTDELKTWKGEWQDLLELLGKPVGIAAAFGLKLVSDTVKDLVGAVQVLIPLWDRLTGIAGFNVKDVRGPALKALDRDLTIEDVKSAWNQSSADKQREAGFWAPKGGGGGGGNVADQIDKAEKEILSTLERQAKERLDLKREEREELLLRQRLGVLTGREEETLERLNRRLAFKKDLVQEATKAWEEQADEVKRVEERIKDVNERIAAERTDLQNALADIDKDAGRRRVDRAAELQRELAELDAKLARGEGNSQRDQERRREIETALGTVDAATRAAGKEVAGLNEFQLIDRDKAQRRADAQEKADARIADLQAELTAEQQKLDTVRAAEAEKKRIVITALEERRAATELNFRQIEEATEAHIRTQAEQYNRLRGAGGSALRRAQGGPVFGPGGPTDDRIPALLSNGEYVVNAQATQLYRPLIEAINSLSLPRFAEGGPVTTHKSATINITNNGRAAEVFADPRRARWYVRSFI